MLHNTVTFSLEMYLFFSANDEERHVDRSKTAEVSPSLELAHVHSTDTHLWPWQICTSGFFMLIYKAILRFRVKSFQSVFSCSSTGGLVRKTRTPITSRTLHGIINGFRDYCTTTLRKRRHGETGFHCGPVKHRSVVHRLSLSF